MIYWLRFLSGRVTGHSEPDSTRPNFDSQKCPMNSPYTKPNYTNINFLIKKKDHTHWSQISSCHKLTGSGV